MSKEVKRYNFDVDKFGSPRAYESEHGRWMKRDDYDALLAERDALEKDWQSECLKKGFEYVREPDDHYVVADPSEMVSLLRDLLGVDVRQKDADSYGESVRELQDQIEGLIDTIHAQESRLEAMKKGAERRVPLYEAVERACGELPEGWEIRICLEHNAGSVELYDEDGNEVDDFPASCERLDYTVNDALEFALQGEQP